MISKVKTKWFLKYLELLVALPIILIALASTSIAQSTDPFSPTPMTTDTIKGRWPSGKRISHYYSFVAGPGTVKVAFNCKPDGTIDGVGGQLLDADGHAFVPIENRNESFNPSAVEDLVYQEGKLLVATYELKRKQKLIIRFYTNNMEKEWGGTYAIKVSGDGVSFNESNASTNNNSTSSSAGNDKTFSLPKSGKLRLVMDDGTVQEINLSRVREATIKP